MIYSHRTYTPYPFQVNTAGLPVGLRIHCLWQYFRRDRGTKLSNYQEWIYKTLGKGYGDTFLVPYSDKFWTVHPREMTSEWTNQRVPTVSPWQMLRGAVISRQTRVGFECELPIPRPRHRLRRHSHANGQSAGERAPQPPCHRHRRESAPC